MRDRLSLDSESQSCESLARVSHRLPQRTSFLSSFRRSIHLFLDHLPPTPCISGMSSCQVRVSSNAIQLIRFREEGGLAFLIVFYVLTLRTLTLIKYILMQIYHSKPPKTRDNHKNRAVVGIEFLEIKSIFILKHKVQSSSLSCCHPQLEKTFIAVAFSWLLSRLSVSLSYHFICGFEEFSTFNDAEWPNKMLTAFPKKTN